MLSSMFFSTLVKKQRLNGDTSGKTCWLQDYMLVAAILSKIPEQPMMCVVVYYRGPIFEHYGSINLAVLLHASDVKSPNITLH